MTKWLVIVNPRSGSGRGRKAAELLSREATSLGVGLGFQYTTGAGHAEQLAREAIAGGRKRIAVCGGDGTVHQALQALAGTDVDLGLIPSGRGNDLARALGIPRDPVAAVRLLSCGGIRTIDLGRVNGRWFSTVACIGFDAAVSERANRTAAPFGGTAVYVWSVLRTLLSFTAPTVRIEVDGAATESPLLLCATANTASYGGGLKIAPKAVPDNGLLDLCAVDALPRLSILRYLPRILNSSHVNLDAVRFQRVRACRLTTDPPLPVYADGEPAGTTPADIEVVPGALGVIVP